jgi:hypothetical protein
MGPRHIMERILNVSQNRFRSGKEMNKCTCWNRNYLDCLPDGHITSKIHPEGCGMAFVIVYKDSILLLSMQE